MDDSHKEQFSVAITAMLETFGQEATAPRLLGYWLGLRDLELADVQKAIANAVRTSHRLPVPAELRDLVHGSSADRAVKAWDDVQRAIPLGSYKHIDFEDQVINAVVRSLGGWPALFERCATSDSEKWYRIEFLKTYQSYAGSGVDGEACKPLAGLSECEIVDGKRSDPIPRRIACDVGRKRISVQLAQPGASVAIEEISS